MNDVSLLIVRPEIKGLNLVRESLDRRGYTIVDDRAQGSWDKVAPEIYGDVLTSKQLTIYLQGYRTCGWGFEFRSLVLHHQDGDTLERLANDKGLLFAYQTGEDTTSLRAEFGWPARWNRHYPVCTQVDSVSNGYSFAPYCGFHAPTTPEELEKNMRILGLTRFVSK